VAPNTSLGVTLMLELVRQAAQALPRNYDIEIVEAHHRNKADAPSGTALALGEAASRVGARVWRSRRYTRATDSRVPGTKARSVTRWCAAGMWSGEHEVWFLGDGERLLLKHSATDRSVFARGACSRPVAGGEAGGTLRDAGCFY
jgi:4-hydroxy-tetrahydrodipicolinate reductase